MDKVLPDGKIMRKYRIKRTKKDGYVLQQQLCWVWVTTHKYLPETDFSCGELDSMVFRLSLDIPVEDWKQLVVRLTHKEQTDESQ